MTQSNVAAALTAAFKSTFQNRATCTKLRKAAVTQVHGTEPSEKHNVAAHMCHRVATAEKHYRYTDKQINSVHSSTIIRDSLTDETVTADSLQVLKRKAEAVELLPTEPYKKKSFGLWKTKTSCERNFTVSYYGTRRQ